MFKKFNLLIFVPIILLNLATTGTLKPFKNFRPLENKIVRLFQWRNNLSNFHTNSWDFIEYTFIEKPNNELKQKQYTLPKIGVTFLGLVAGKIILKTICNGLMGNKNKIGLEKLLYYSLRTFGTIGSGYLAYSLLNEYISHPIEFNILKNFVASWPQNKEFTPKELHKSFDKLHALYKSNYKQFEQESRETLRLIRKRIYGKFPNKYKNLNDSLFNFKLLTTNINFNFKSGMSDIIEYIKK